MNKKNLFIIFMIILILFVIGILVYPIFYKDKTKVGNTNTIEDTTKNMEQIDILSNLSFFKILVEDKNYKEGSVFAEKFVTIRDSENITGLQDILKTATVFNTNDARGYDTCTTALCYLDDNTMCNFFVIDSDTIVFSDDKNNKTMYKLDKKYDIEKFLTNLYNINVNSSQYSILEKNGKYGITYSNKTIINPKYDNIAIINPNVDVFCVTLNNVTKFIDKSGENPFTNFEEVDLLPATAGGESLWYENAIKFKSNGKYGLASLDGSIFLQPEYDNIEALNYIKDYLIITQDEKQKVIKLCTSGYEEITGSFDSIKILGVDLKFINTDKKYENSDSLVIVGINNAIREQYFELSE